MASVAKKVDVDRERFRQLYLEGQLDEARTLASDCFMRASTPDERLAWANNQGIVERKAGNFQKALAIYLRAEPLADQATDRSILGKYRMGFGCLYQEIGEQDSDPFWFAQAIAEFTLAEVFYERAGDWEGLAKLKNNRGYLLISMGRPEEAAELVAEARTYFERAGEAGRCAEIDRTEAQRHLKAGRLHEATLSIIDALRAVSGTSEAAVLADCWETVGAIKDAYDRERKKEQVKLALVTAKGSLTKAAPLLGLESAEGVNWRIKNKFPELDDFVVRRGGK